MALIDIINGKKKLKGKSSQLLIKGLEIDNSEKMFLQSIIERSLTSDEEKIKMYNLLVEELRPYGQENYSCFRESADLNLFSHWIYMSIFSMTNIPNFQITPENVKESLRIEVEESVIENALFDLFEKVKSFLSTVATHLKLILVIKTSLTFIKSYVTSLKNLLKLIQKKESFKLLQ